MPDQNWVSSLLAQDSVAAEQLYKVSYLRRWVICKVRFVFVSQNTVAGPVLVMFVFVFYFAII